MNLVARWEFDFENSLKKLVSFATADCDNNLSNGLEDIEWYVIDYDMHLRCLTLATKYIFPREWEDSVAPILSDEEKICLINKERYLGYFKDEPIFYSEKEGPVGRYYFDKYSDILTSTDVNGNHYYWKIDTNYMYKYNSTNKYEEITSYNLNSMKIYYRYCINVSVDYFA